MRTTSVFRLFRAPALVLCLPLILALIAACGGGDSSDPTVSVSGVTSATASPTRKASGSATETPTPTAVPTMAPTPVRTPNDLPTLGNTPTPGPTAVNALGDEKLFLVLGDSLGYGNGSSDRGRTSFAALTYAGLGAGYEVLNLAVPGYTSQDLIDRELDSATTEMESRLNDGIPGNETAGISLEIGGNDLLNLYDSLVVSGLCPSVPEALQKQECVDGLKGALDNYKPHLETILDRLRAADPNVPIFVSTLYNPFSGGSVNLDGIGVLALEGQDGTPFPEGLNDIIREVTAAKGDILVEWYPLFIGGVNTLISRDLIHPNDIGHSLMAQALLDAMHAHGVGN
ncbi:MAG: GDSL-type esterase/lipase family protein [Chloroflexota bacterium]